ncbi:hypothetical protein HYH03_005968 [Edaphochlamys debaryana]|uniref:1-phosphatidylinositol 4-kinase n=1 Tax=Edaphochlamys debaryana TaxID=47281 RepID=A0A836C1W8_9CHLO|nr:hypothetical protein HYH03_005968 [Edaphochlamys debaryana]|eukprot:KAG2496048.1 hypothetical protein HYH03_005968 [Edaphochlamys debaryana]
MDMESTASMRSLWAEALASANPAEESKVALLLQLCSPQGAQGADADVPAQRSIRDIAANILPLISFVNKSGGQRAELLVPEVAQQLKQLSVGSSEPVADPDALEGTLEGVFTSLRSLLRNVSVKLEWRRALSEAVRELLTKALQAVLRMPQDGAPPGPAVLPSAPAQVLLRTLTRSAAFVTGSGVLPLLAPDAAAILAWAVDNILPPGAKSAVPAPVAPQPGTRAAISAAAAGDEKVLLLLSHLARTMLAGPGAAAPHAAAPGANGTPTVTATAATADGAAAANGDAPAVALGAAQERTVLGSLLGWSMGLLRSTLTRLLTPATGLDSLDPLLLAGKQAPPAAGSGASVSAPGQQPASAGVTRAVARLAASAMHGLLMRPEGDGAGVEGASGGRLPAAARAQLGDVISLLLDMAEACVSAALEIGPQVPASDKMLDIAAYILEDCTALIAIASEEAAATSSASSTPTKQPANGPSPAAPAPAAAPPAADMGTVFSRLKAILLAAASLVGSDDGAGWRGCWAWDLTRPLMASYVPGSRTPGWGAQRLCCTVAEALACGLAASHQAAGGKGSGASYARALLLLPLSVHDVAGPAPAGGTASAGGAGGSAGAGANEAQVLSLAMGRLFVLLRGDDALGRSMVPLLTDVLGQPAASPAVASLQASVVQTLAAMASASVLSELSTTWSYGQASDVLLRLLLPGKPGSAAAALAAGANGLAAGALAAGLLALAKGIRKANSAVRRDFRNRLLVSVGELGLRAGGGERRGVVAEMGALLPAVAEACEGLDGPGTAPSGVRFSFRDVAAAQRSMGGNGMGHGDGPGAASRADLAQLSKLLRHLWLYVALFELASPESASPQQLGAAGRIAACTPVLLLGEAGADEAELAEFLKAELGDRLRLAGASPAGLRASLQKALGVGLGGLQPPPDGNKQAYLLLVATAELSRARHAPLVSDAEASPIALALTYLAASIPGSPDAAWYTVIADTAFAVYLRRLKSEAAAAAAPPRSSVSPAAAAAAGRRGGSVDGSVPTGRGPSYPAAVLFPAFPVRPPMETSSRGPFAAAAVSAETEAAEEEDDAGGAAGALPHAHLSGAGGGPNVYERCLEGLAVTLIRHLAVAGGHEEGVAPQAAVVADRLLSALLREYSPLYWSHTCMAALLDELESEEGLDHPLSQGVPGSANLSRVAAAAAPGGGGRVWHWLHTWVYQAASSAPTRTEALLHQFLAESSISTNTLEPSISTGGGTGSLAAAGGGAAAAAQVAQRAHAAALRRAADLLGVCAKARGGAVGGAGAGASADGTMALCRKMFFSGAIAGVKFSQGGHSADPVTVAQVTLQSLEEGLAAAHHNPRMAENRYLAAAAFLAREAAEDVADGDLGGSEAHAVSYRILQALCTAPLKRFTPDMMGLAVFSWTWVTTAGPGWLVPLVSRSAAAWSASVDRRLGLFSGPHRHRSAAPEPDPGTPAALSAEAEILGALSCHHQWTAFLFEMWSSVGDRTDAEQRSLAAVYDRLLHHSLADPEGRMCTHPAAAAARFRLLQLALAYCRHCSALRPRDSPCPPSLALLHHRVLRAGLLWFAAPLRFTARMSARQAEEQTAALRDFLALLESVRAWPEAPAGPVYDAARHGPSQVEAANWGSVRLKASAAVWGPHAGDLSAVRAAALLTVLCRAEEARLRVWASPLKEASATGQVLSLGEEHVQTAWKVSPALAVAIVERCPPPAGPGPSRPHKALQALLQGAAADPRVQAIPEAALLLATPEAAKAKAKCLDALALWAPAGAVEGLQLMAGPALLHAGVKAYALRCLHATPPAKVAFFLPQLVQALRADTDGATARFLLETAAADDLFCHQLIWALATEERPPEEEFNPEVKRSGWQPPQDTGLWSASLTLKSRALQGMTPASEAYYKAEAGYFDKITSISGILKRLEPDERRGKIRSELEAFAPDRPDLYVPTNPDCRVLAHIPESGCPMQSAAKVPILVAFKVEQAQPAPLPPINRSLACIFKVGDDCRQDVLALQVISILRDAFTSAGLELYLRPYGCIPTGYGRGVIEVVPNTKSRAALGELSDRGLHEIFVSQFGPPGSPAFEAARRNFITSEAGYAIASYLLQAKDRHNGNLLIDSDGHLVHIDFGFILEISPGGNMGFESAAFKLSHEMTQLLDPGGMRNSGHFRLFEELCVRGYLAARTVAEPIIASVALMADSGLPCFGHGKPLINLRKRFHLEMSDAQAAAFMRATIADAYQKWTTGFYDYIQLLQNRIPY